MNLRDLASQINALYRCRWCTERIGHPSWFRGDGSYTAAPDIPEHEITDSICPTCRGQQLDKLMDRIKELTR